MQEQLITLKTAIQAKKLGFKVEGDTFQTKEKGVCKIGFEGESLYCTKMKGTYFDVNGEFEDIGERFPAITQSLLQKWLRVKYNYEVYVLPQFKKGKCGYDSFKQIGYAPTVLTSLKGSEMCRYLGYPMFETSPEDMLDPGETLETLEEDTGYKVYNSYEEALEAGLYEALEIAERNENS